MDQARFMMSETLPTCQCGYDRTHHNVVPKPTYGFWAWFLLIMGATGKPKKIVYRCLSCKQTVETTRDPRVLRKFS